MLLLSPSDAGGSAPLVFVLLGLAAGTVTTLAGQGGGLLLLLACASVIGPREALALTAPALLFGNLHRAFLLRAHVDRSVASQMILGAAPGAVAGGLLVGIIPTSVLRVLLVAMTLLAIGKALGLVAFRVSPKALVPAGALIGVMTGTSSGAGVLFAPVLLSTGLTGRAFVATSSAIAIAVHIGRVAGYATLGLFTRGLVGPTIAITIAIAAGNALGERVRTMLLGDGATKPNERGAADERERQVGRLFTALEYGVLAVCVVLSVSGFGG